MLNHKSTETETPGLASEVRVTPAELANAVASLQARNQELARRLEGTIPIGQALEELSLDTTPEEVLAEVEALRRVRRRRPRIGGKRLKAVVLALVSLGLLTGIGYDLDAIGGSPPEMHLYQETMASLQRKLIVQDRTAQGPVLRTLAEVPEGRTVFCSVLGALYIVDSRMATTGPIPGPDNDGSDATWRIVKLDGDIYLRGWVRERLSPESCASVDHLTVYNAPGAPGLGSRPVPISLKLTGVPGFSPFGDRAFRRTMPSLDFLNFHPNRHTWGKW